jgi:hypothetical protein
MSDEMVSYLRGLRDDRYGKLAEWDRIGRTYDSTTFEYRGEIVRDIRWLNEALA